MDTVRRSDRGIKDMAEILTIIKKCDVCRLALCEDNVPYMVPMSYGFEHTDNKLTLYFHCAKEGKKLDIISRNPVAWFEMDCSHRMIEGTDPCGYTMEYECVMGCGRISFCTEKSEKITALTYLMKTYAGDRNFIFSDAELDSVAVFRLEASEFSAKRLKKVGR